MKIYSRSEWGARAPKGELLHQDPPGEAFVHYSDDTNAASLKNFNAQAAKARQIQAYHLDAKGWNDIGYHYLVFQPYGFLRRARVFQGRYADQIPAAQIYHNAGTLAICVVAGPGNKLKRNTRFQIEELLRKHKSVQTLGGHRDVVATSCPGDEIYSWLPTIARAALVKVYKKG